MMAMNKYVARSFYTFLIISTASIPKSKICESKDACFINVVHTAKLHPERLY